MILEPKPVGCHHGCIEITGGTHVTLVTPVDMEEPDSSRWRSECDTCATVLNIAEDQHLALLDAVNHAVEHDGHVNYPHMPGLLYDCPACEAKCHCDSLGIECVFEGAHVTPGL